MKKILCYGDSNTFGYNQKTSKRFKEDERWSGILKNNFKNYFEIIEAGLNNRTGFTENSAGVEYCAIKHFPDFFENLKDIKLVILSIGINDLQIFYNVCKLTYQNGLKKLISQIKEKGIDVILICPPVLDERILNGYFREFFDKNSIEKSKELPRIYKKIAKEFNCGYFDFNLITKTSDFDGLHYDKEAHRQIAKEFGDYLRAFMKV